MGGWTSPIPGVQLLPGFIWFLVKVFALVFMMMWIRWTVPRVRVDQLMSVCWKYFLPISFVNIIGTGEIVQ